MSASASLLVRDLTVRFGGLCAVDGVGLEVERGQVVGLIGPNGAGKSTVINAISGYVRPTGGSVLVNGREVVGRRPYAIARLGLVRTFQTVELFDDLTVAENVLVALEASRRRRSSAMAESAAAIVDSLGLGAFAARLVSHLSYPDRKLAELARAIAAGASVVLLDEPMAGVPASARARIVERLLEQVQTRQMAALVVEHDMSVIRDMSHRVYAMDTGAVVAAGPYADVVNDDRVQRAYLGTGIA